jgi:hypothetical protein
MGIYLVFHHSLQWPLLRRDVSLAFPSGKSEEPSDL